MGNILVGLIASLIVESVVFDLTCNKYKSTRTGWLVFFVFIYAMLYCYPIHEKSVISLITLGGFLLIGAMLPIEKVWIILLVASFGILLIGCSVGDAKAYILSNVVLLYATTFVSIIVYSTE